MGMEAERVRPLHVPAPVICDCLASCFLPRGCSLEALVRCPGKEKGEIENENACDEELDFTSTTATTYDERQWYNSLGNPLEEKHVINASPNNVDCHLYSLSTVPTIDQISVTIPYSQSPPPYNEVIKDLPPEYHYPPFSPISAQVKDPIQSPLAPAKTATTAAKTQKNPSLQQQQQQLLLFIEPTLDVSIDWNTPYGLREHAKKKKSAKKQTPAPQQSVNHDNKQDQGADEGGGDAGNGENDKDGNNDSGAGGGGDDEGGGGGDDDWSGWNIKGKKKYKKQGEEEEEEEEEQKKKAAEEAEAAALKPPGNLDLSWADEAEGNDNDNDPWGGFAAVSGKKKKKKGKDADPASTAATDDNGAFQDINLNENPPQLDLNLGSSDPKTQPESGFSFANWGKNMAKGLGSFVNSSVDDGAKSSTADGNNPWSTTDANNGTVTDNTTANATEEKPTKDHDIWAGSATIKKNKQRKNKEGLAAAEDSPKAPEPEPKQEPEASTDNPWVFGLSKKEQRKAKKAGKKTEPEPESNPAPLVDTGDIGKTKEKKSLSWADDDLLGEDPAPAAEPPAATKAELTDDSWLGGWHSSGKKGKNGKSGSIAVEESSQPPPEPVPPAADPEPKNQNAEDDWAGWAVSKKDKNKKKDAGKTAAEDTPAPEHMPEKEPEPEPIQEPVEEPKPPALPDDPLYNNWTTLSSKDRKKREKSLKKKGLPVPDSNGEIKRPEPIPEAKPEQPAPELAPEPKPEPEPEPEHAQGNLEDPAPETVPPEPTQDKPSQGNDSGWGIWNPFFKDTKKKGRKGNAMEESQDSLPPPAPTPPPALGHDPVIEDVNGETPLDGSTLDNTANAKNTKKSKSNTDQSKLMEVVEEQKPDPVVEEPPTKKETPAKEAPTKKETPAKSARGFWASLGAASVGNPKTITKSKPEQKTKSSDVKQVKTNGTKDAQDDDLLVDVGEDTDKKEEAPPATKSSGDITSNPNTVTAETSVLDRVKALEQKKAVNEKAPEKSEEQTALPPESAAATIPAQEEPAQSKKTTKTKTATKSASKEQAPDTAPMLAAEMEEPSREMLPGSFPDEPAPEPEPEPEPEPKPEPEPVKTSKKIKKTPNKKTSTTAKEPATTSKTKAPPKSTPEPEKSTERSKTDSKKTATASAPAKKSEPPEKAADGNKKGTKETSAPTEDSPNADAPDANGTSPSTPQPKPAEPGKSTKKERPSTHRAQVSSSWGFWGPVPPKTPKSQAKQQKDEAAANNTKAKESEQQGEKPSDPDKDTSRETGTSTQNRPMNFNNFNLGGAPPSRAKSLRKTENSSAARTTSRAVPKTASRYRSDKDEIETPSKPRGGKPVVTDKTAAMLGVNGSKSRRERHHSHTKKSGARDHYAVDSADNSDPHPREDGSKESADVGRRIRRMPRPKSYVDGSNAADAEQTRRAPETSPERDDGLAYGEAPQPRVVRSNTVPKRPETGGLMGLFGSIRRAARADPPPGSRVPRDGYVTETEREEVRSRRRQSRKPDIVDDRGYTTDAGPAGGSRHSDEEDEDARRAAHRARRASRHAGLEQQTRKKGLREAEERKRQKEKERVREARERRAREEQEREEARREERRARRAAREERRVKEEQEAREAAVRVEAKEAKRRERERERRRIKEEEMREISRRERERSKSKRRSSRVVVENDYAPDDHGPERRHRSHRSGDERGRSQRRKSQALNEAAEAPPVAPGKKEKIANWVNAQAEDPPEPPPVVGTVLDSPPSTGSPHTHSLSSDEESRQRLRRQKRMRSKYPGLTDEEIDEIHSRRRQARRSRRDGVKTSSGSGDYERERERDRYRGRSPSRSRNKRVYVDDRYGYPPVSSGPKMPNWLRKLTR